MYTRRIPPFKPGDVISASQIDAVRSQAERNGMVRSSGRVSRTGNFKTFSDEETGFYVTISGSASPYSFQEISWTGPGTTENGPRSGTTNAYEMNAATSLNNTIQWLERGWYNDYRFQALRYGSGGLPSLCCPSGGVPATLTVTPSVGTVFTITNDGHDFSGFSTWTGCGTVDSQVRSACTFPASSYVSGTTVIVLKLRCFGSPTPGWILSLFYPSCGRVFGADDHGIAPGVSCPTMTRMDANDNPFNPGGGSGIGGGTGSGNVFPFSGSTFRCSPFFQKYDASTTDDADTPPTLLFPGLNFTITP